MIIDAHAHIFPEIHGRTQAGEVRGIGYGRVRFGGRVQQILPPYHPQTEFTPEMLLANLDWAGVDRAILLQGPFYGECNRYVQEAIAKYPQRLSGMAFLDPWGDDGRAAFDWIRNLGAFKGIKLEFSQSTGLSGIHPTAELAGSQIEWLWNALENNHMVVVLDLGAIGSNGYQTQSVHQIAADHPGLKIVIAHLGQPDPEVESKADLWKLWEEQINLGLLENVWFDCAALPAYLPGELYPYPTAAKYLRIAISRIGPSKILWGTDQPGLLAHASLPQLISMTKHHIDYLSPEEQAMIMGNNAAGVFGL